MRQVATVPSGGSELTPGWLTRPPAFPEVSHLVAQRGADRRGPRARQRDLPGAVVGTGWGRGDHREAVGHPRRGRVGGGAVLLDLRAGRRHPYPACRCAAIDDQTGRRVPLLEDLTPAVQGDVLEELPGDAASSVASGIAGLHARWWSHPLLDEATWLPRAARPRRDAAWFAPRRARFLEQFGDRLDRATLALLADIEALHGAGVSRLTSAAGTLLHQDLRLDNLLLEPTSGRPLLLDWVRVARGPALLDVTELLYGIGQPDDGDALLEAYLGGLAGGVEVDRSELEHELAAAMAHRPRPRLQTHRTRSWWCSRSWGFSSLRLVVALASRRAGRAPGSGRR